MKKSIMNIYKLLSLLALGIVTACGEPVIEEEEEIGFTYNPCDLTPVSADGGVADPLLPYQWYLQAEYADVVGAWALSNNGDNRKDIEIGVIDDALQRDHEDLNSFYNSGINASINVFAPANHAHAKNPYPTKCTGNVAKQHAHGTSVAGIIAGAKNDQGIKGVAYNAKVWGANLIMTGGFSEDALDKAFNNRVTTTTVMSNSWGDGAPTMLANVQNSYFTLIESGLNNGFAGEGISYVFAAGNNAMNATDTDRKAIPNSQDRSSYSERLNHRGIIVVCAVGEDHQVSEYSEQGPNLWLCGYSNSGRNGKLNAITDITTEGHLSNTELWRAYGLPTLDLSGTAGYNNGQETIIKQNDPSDTSDTKCLFTPAQSFNFGSPFLTLNNCQIEDTATGMKVGTGIKNKDPILWNADNAAGTANSVSLQSYHRYFTGTSAATPLVSGVIGLMRAAKSDLTWRDVKLILAETAKQPDGVTFGQGGATYSSDDGYTNYTYNDAYGFGIVNASAAVKLAQAWVTTPETPELLKSATPSETSYSSNPAITLEESATAIDFIEYVQVEIQGGQGIANFGDLDLKLTSPSVVESVFAKKHQCATKQSRDSDIYKATDECPAFNSSFTFGSAKYLGESPDGTWRLTATLNGRTHPLNWRLTIHGHNNPDR